MPIQGSEGALGDSKKSVMPLCLGKFGNWIKWTLTCSLDEDFWIEFKMWKKKKKMWSHESRLVETEKTIHI